LSGKTSLTRDRPRTAPDGTAHGWADLFGWEIQRDNGTPVFRQVYLQIRLAILSRRLGPGTKLPSTRALASELVVARTSVVAAYEQLLAEGYVSGKIGSGTYISSELSDAIETPARRPKKTAAREKPSISPQAQKFAAFAPPAAAGANLPFDAGRALVDPRTTQIWGKLSKRVLVSIDPVHLGYSDPRGLIELRTAICDYLRATRAVQCGPDQIIVTSGTQQALDIAIRVLLSRDDEAWVEDPCYMLTYQALSVSGVRIHPIAVDASGINVAAGIRSAPKARVAFVTPSHQHPLGVVLSMARRLELLAWARETKAWIVEDDYDSEFRYAGRPLASLQGLDDSDRVIYVGTYSKALFPGLRLGYAVVPPALASAFAGARYLMDRHPPSLSQIVLSEFMRQGHYASHIRRTRLVYRKARDTLVDQLRKQIGKDMIVESPDQGRHLIAYLRGSVSDVAIERAARENSLVVRAISRLYRKAPPRSGLMLGFAGFSPSAIARGVSILARIVQRR
jgi:GntR family transcriptional regulator / MocR family aminotransferase